VETWGERKERKERKGKRGKEGRKGRREGRADELYHDVRLLIGMHALPTDRKKKSKSGAEKNREKVQVVKGGKEGGREGGREEGQGGDAGPETYEVCSIYSPYHTHR